MFSVFKKSVLIVLAMLQFLAPLVHAHTGASHPHGGIHMPGLEAYLNHQHAPALEKVNSAWPSSEGFLVMVDAGIKNTKDALSHSVGYNFCCVDTGLLHQNLPEQRPQNFSPQKRILPPSSSDFPPHAPRAPPHHHLAFL